MWRVPILDAEDIENMEVVLNVGARPYDAREAVVAFTRRRVARRETDDSLAIHHRRGRVFGYKRWSTMSRSGRRLQ